MSNMQIALEITALGMGLVFAAIILLWWMMTLLTFITAAKESTPDSQKVDTFIDKDYKAQAAAVAVAMALAEQQTSGARPLSTPPTAIISAWQLGMRTKQLYQKGEPIKRQRRKLE